MKTFLQILVLNLFFIQIINAQNCVNDSVVVHEYFENDNNSQGLLVQTIIETSVFNRDSGTVRIYTRSSVMGGPYTPSSFIDAVWVHTDTIRNVSGAIDQIYSKIGSVTGWQNYKTENYQYNAANFILSKTNLNWNGGAWDSVSYNTWNYDVQNNLIESADYFYSSGIRNNQTLREIVYQNGQPYSKTISTGVAINQWQVVSRFIFNYTGNLRTDVEVDYYDINSGSWQMYGQFNYNNNFGEYSFIFPEYTPIVLNGISSADTLLTGYDTLEERTYIRNVHFTAIDTTDIYFGVQGAISYYIYNHLNNQLLLTFLWISSWATLDLTDSIWYSMDRPYTDQYLYDLTGRCDTILTHGACTNPCVGEQDFLYDSLGRLYYNSSSWETMTGYDHSSNTYYFSDTASLSILIARNDSNVTGCPGGTFQPNISVIGGCQPYTVQWYPSNGLSSDTVLQPDILIDSMITYTVVVQDNMGLIDSSTVTVSSGYSPQIIVDTVYCNGNTDLRLPWATGTFQWYLDSVIIPGAGTYYHTATFPGEYHVSGLLDVGNNYTHLFSCPIQSDTVTVQPIQLPVLSFSNDTIFTNISGIQYDWFLDSVLINSGSDAFLIINQDGSYQVTVTLQSGCTYSSNLLNVFNTGIVSPEKSFSISPNPVHDKLLINGLTEQQVIITDLSGKNICQPRVNADQSIDVSFLTNGSYFLFIKTESGNRQFRFMKM